MLNKMEENSENIILSKITSPKLHAKIMPRQRLKDLLTGNTSKIWSIVAGPGYGKTICLLELKEALKIPAAWYSTDEQDNDFNNFIIYLIRSIQISFSSFGQNLIEIIKTYSDNKEIDIKKIFINELTNLDQEILIIIDNFHKIMNTTEINDFTLFLMNYLPPKVYLAISSRQILPFNFNKFSYIGQVINITTQDLKFSIKESLDMLNHSLGPVEMNNRVNDVLGFIDGWILGLLLLIQNIRKNGNTQNIDIKYFKNLTYTTINGYFNSELMNFFSKEINDFLFSTSIPENFSFDMCQNIFNLSKDTFLKYIDNNPFIEDYYIQDEVFYKYHEVFRQFLLKESVNRFSADELMQIHEKTGDYYALKEIYPLAINQYLSIKDYEKAIAAIEKLADRYLLGMNIRTLESWIDQFPPGLTNINPYLLRLKGEIHYNNGNLTEAIDFYKKAEMLCKENGDLGNLFTVIINLMIASFKNNDSAATRNYLTIAQSYKDKMPLVKQLEFLIKHSFVVNDDYECIEILKQIESLSWDSEDTTVNYIRYYALRNLSFKYSAINNMEKAIFYMEKLINETEDDYKYFLKANLALYHFGTGDIKNVTDLLTEIDEWLKNCKQYDLKTYNITVLTVLQLLLYFDDNSSKEKFKYYLDYLQKYIMTINNCNFIEHILLTYLSAIFARKENNLTYAIKLHKESINELKKSQFSISVFGLMQKQVKEIVLKEYLYTSLLASDFDEVIRTANEYQDGELSSIHLCLCAAYLRHGKNEMTDKGIELLKIIMEKIGNKEYLLITRPLILETLLPVIFRLNEEQGISLWEKALQTYKCNIKPYLINKIIPLIPCSIIHRNENLVEKLEKVMDKPFISINVLGDFNVRIGTQKVRWERQNMKKLFALLVLYPNGINQDNLSEELFSEKIKGEDNLRTLIHCIRRLFESDSKTKKSNIIFNESGRYSLNLDSLFYCFDLKEFLSHYEKGLKALKGKKNNIVYSEYMQASGYYRGDLLQDINSILLEPLKENYRRKYIDILLFLIEYTFNDMPEDCFDYIHQLLSCDRYEEQAYRYLMKYYHKKGRKDLIKKYYMEYKNIIEQELKFKLSESTEKLYKELMEV